MDQPIPTHKQPVHENRQGLHEYQPHEGHAGHHNHAAMIADFRRRFWVSLVVTIPILILSPLIQKFLGITKAVAFPGDSYVLFGLSTVVYFYGGWPFLKGLFSELAERKPAMMTLIALGLVIKRRQDHLPPLRCYVDSLTLLEDDISTVQAAQSGVVYILIIRSRHHTYGR